MYCRTVRKWSDRKEIEFEILKDISVSRSPELKNVFLAKNSMKSDFWIKLNSFIEFDEIWIINSPYQGSLQHSFNWISLKFQTINSYRLNMFKLLFYRNYVPTLIKLFYPFTPLPFNLLGGTPARLVSQLIRKHPCFLLAFSSNFLFVREWAKVLKGGGRGLH